MQHATNFGYLTYRTKEDTEKMKRKEDRLGRISLRKARKRTRAHTAILPHTNTHTNALKTNLILWLS